MNETTALALRAIIRGLRFSDAINAEQVEGVVAELRAAAQGEEGLNRRVESGELRSLANGIGDDTERSEVRLPGR